MIKLLNQAYLINLKEFTIKLLPKLKVGSLGSLKIINRLLCSSIIDLLYLNVGKKDTKFKSFIKLCGSILNNIKQKV
jgi:hypothetical protein